MVCSLSLLILCQCLIFRLLGMPAAWMISSNGQEETIDYFLNTIRTLHPTVIPKRFMSDKDRAQLNAIQRRYAESCLLLCWWHVLHAWQQHFVTCHHPELWELLKKWVRITDEVDFETSWDKIKAIAPPSMIEYLQTNWLDERHLWSAVYRQDRTIFEMSDTNMLVEAYVILILVVISSNQVHSWHHLLKGDFLEGKRNRRLDHLLHALTQKAIPHFIARHRRQAYGFEGPDLALKRRMEIERRADSIEKADITPSKDEANIFSVKSQSDDAIDYEVDLEDYNCTCLSFPVIRYCKHISAVQKHYPETVQLIPASALDITAPTEIPDQTSTATAASLVDDDTTNKLARIAEISLKLQDLANRLKFNPHVEDHDALEDLEQELDAALSAIQPRSMLPPKKKIAPNQHSWTETAAVMGVAVKSKRKAHTDPYGGGERPGKKAKPDARQPYTLTQAAQVPPPQPSVPTPSAISVATPTISALSPSAPSRATLPVQLPLLEPSTSAPTQGQVPALVPVFDEAHFDLTDTSKLQCLKRQFLNKLCKFHKVKANGTNEDVISRLQSISGTSQAARPSSSLPPLISSSQHNMLRT